MHARTEPYTLPLVSILLPVSNMCVLCFAARRKALVLFIDLLTSLTSTPADVIAAWEK